MACVYCDESGKKGRTLSLPQVLRKVRGLEKKHGPHSCISLTGGEPLLYADFLRRLCPALKKMKYRVLLETSGVLWRNLSKVLPCCDIISMDLKLPSVTRQGSFLKEHEAFLKIAKRKEFYIKIVVSKDLDRREYDAHVRMVAREAPWAPVFLQAAARGRRVFPDKKLWRLLEDLCRRGAGRLPGLRIGIQLHKLLNIA
jgi:organic radical activating enzyme